jgi:hypothetical protein
VTSIHQGLSSTRGKSLGTRLFYYIFEEFDFQIFLILYIELCILTLLAYVFVTDIGWPVAAMKLRSAVLTFSLMHVITLIIYSLLHGNA